MRKRSRVLIGTSGWHYAHWKGVFYPDAVSPPDFLRFYAARFRTAEINNTFYNLPGKETFEVWHDTVEPGFVFAVKASRYITHMKKLKDAAAPVERFVELARTLGDRLGPILFQLPPRWKFNAERLDEFVKSLPLGMRYAFEFRDPSWFDPAAYDILKKQGAAFCIYDLEGTGSPREVTCDFVYVRLHGPGAAYQGSYPDKTLVEWARTFVAWRDAGLDVYCYFNNDWAGNAVENALRLRLLIDGE